MITGKRVILVISVIYFTSLTISIPPVLGWRKQHYETGVCYLPYSAGYVIYSAIGSFYLPFAIMSVLYCKIYKVAKTHMESIKKRSVVGSLLDLGDGGEGGGDMERSDSRALFFSDDRSITRRLTSSSSGYSSSKPGQRFLSEKKAAKTVSIIVGAFMVCWTPFSIVYLLNGLCKEECKVSDTAFKVCFWLGYLNSVINPIIYSVTTKT
ncbi:ADRA1A [Bugula neritina]|uniref:ADRA1A n=1 Tax=Bugula neritina TaxID=10212 RepID=A0A7J7JRW0_BUGNE|nr:ADRA1A [Bugula neritina]